MVHRYPRYVLWLVMTVVGVALIVDILYLLNGSLEQFPTEEQEDKVRTVTSAIAVLLSVTELGLWWLLRQVERPNTIR